MLLLISLLASASFVTSLALSSSSARCSSITESIQLSLYHTAFLNATYYPANSLNISSIFNDVSFCEVYASTIYKGNNTLVFALWLPDASEYQDRFLAVGNGGMAGVIDYAGMVAQLNSGNGVAVAGGNAGHLASQNNDGGGAPGIPLPYLHDENQVTAWIHDAISLFTPAAKALTAAYYNKAPSHAYYYGCSTGGAQGFALAQYHPELFDGIYAGSPGNWYSHLALSFLWNAQHTNTSAANLSQAALNLTTNAVLDACDTIDGVPDRLIEDPLNCHFEIDSLACTAYSSNATTNQASCLTPAQVAAAKAIYSGPKRSDNGSQLYPGFSFGSEIEWMLQEGDLAKAFSIPILQHLVFDDLKYDSDNFNWASDVKTLDMKAGGLIDEISLDLSAYRNRGGKMLVSQGWADPYNAATWPIHNLEQLQKHSKSSISDFYHLFMVPGGGHCGAASYYPSVPATYHVLPVMIDWVEKGCKPESILTSDPPDGSKRTRKLCPWPATAKYVAGDVNDWGSYVCH